METLIQIGNTHVWNESLNYSALDLVTEGLEVSLELGWFSFQIKFLLFPLSPSWNMDARVARCLVTTGWSSPLSRPIVKRMGHSMNPLLGLNAYFVSHLLKRRHLFHNVLFYKLSYLQLQQRNPPLPLLALMVPIAPHLVGIMVWVSWIWTIVTIWKPFKHWINWRLHKYPSYFYCFI